MIKRTGFLHHAVARIIVSFVFLLAIAGCQTVTPSVSLVKPERLTKNLYVVGHRGAAGLAPENTLSGFKRALDLGVDAIELDVLLTSDRKLVVHHDYRLKPEIARTPNGAWLMDRERPAIKDLTLAELKTYDVGRLKPNTKYARRYPKQQPADGERIPTLREVISLFKSYDKETQLWVEIKTSPEKPDMTPPPEAVADAVVHVLREEKFAHRARILSFDWRSLVYVQEIATDIPTVYVSHIGRRLNNIKPGQPGPSPWMAGFDVDDYDGSIPRAIKAAGGQYWDAYYRYITPNLVEEAHRLGIQVFVWTPDSGRDMLRSIEMGVDGITTNRPDILRSILSGNPG
ncbi:MAG: glycerophosphodiester phosphodiesterase [Deltaproteobacteria bacterium]|nr:glycerophosphodiester phosphodiesterase [Deltaproteobacteria bacterium]